MPATLSGPSKEDFKNHINSGGHIKYASIQWINNTTTKKLISTDSNTEFLYSFDKDNNPIMKRFRFGKLATIGFRLEFVELINPQIIPNVKQS